MRKVILAPPLKMNDSFKQEALASWEEYLKTGLHLTGGEVREWLNTWGTDDEKDAPECHTHMHGPSDTGKKQGI